ANKAMLREITEIASKFFELNDIQINGKKSKLVILNTSLRKEESQVFFGSEIVKAENIATTTRFLGVWLNRKMKELLIRKKHVIVRQFTIALN
ncbi:5797_t:CDS:1, partial [Gigaspora margarita]